MTRAAQSDVLTVNGPNVLTPAIAPRPSGSTRCSPSITVSTGSPTSARRYPRSRGLPFISGADVFMPASTPPDAPSTSGGHPRGGGGQVERLNIPNWASSTNFTSIQLRDFVQPIRHHGDDDDGHHHSDDRDDSRRHSDDHDD